MSGPGTPTVFIGGQIAARVTDAAACANVVDFVVTGAATVLIGGLPAARVLEHTLHGGTLTVGSPSVLIGGSVLGRPVRASTFFPGKQQGNDTCALMSTQGILHQATGDSKTEAQMRAIGQASGAYTPGQGTTNEAEVLNQAGIPATRVLGPTTTQVAQALGEQRAVIVGYDARPVWGVASPQPLGHAVRATGVEFDANGQPSAVYINDTGSGKAGERVPVATFNQAMGQFGGGRMAVTTSPVP